MSEFKQLSLFDEYIDDNADENILETYRGYSFVQEPEQDDEGYYVYKVFDEFGILNKTWSAARDCMSMPRSAYLRCNVRSIFKNYVDSLWREKDIEKNKRKAAIDASRKEVSRVTAANNRSRYSYYDKYEDDDDSFFNLNRSFGGYSYNYQPRPKDTGYLDKLNKSDTLVIHCQDSTTEMLGQVYEGRGWDVLRNGNIDKDELHQLMESHDRIICLGHGTPSGLINKQGGGYVIGPEEAPYFKGKKIFAIWCNADKYFKQHDIGHGQFITKNVPSEVWECRAVGYTVSAQFILENITYWSKCCADVVDQALSGDVKGAVEKARAAYQSKYGDDPNPQQRGVTDYNTDAIQVQP